MCSSVLLEALYSNKTHIEKTSISPHGLYHNFDTWCLIVDCVIIDTIRILLRGAEGRICPPESYQ